jgi:hypothetical protein
LELTADQPVPPGLTLSPTRYGYFVALATLGALGASMLYYLHRKKML